MYGGGGGGGGGNARYWNEPRSRYEAGSAPGPAFTYHINCDTGSYYRKESAAVLHKLDAKFPNPVKVHY